MGQICQNIDSHAAGNNTPFPLSVKFCVKRPGGPYFQQIFCTVVMGQLITPGHLWGIFLSCRYWL